MSDALPAVASPSMQAEHKLTGILRERHDIVSEIATMLDTAPKNSKLSKMRNQFTGELDRAFTNPTPQNVQSILRKLRGVLYNKDESINSAISTFDKLAKSFKEETAALGSFGDSEANTIFTKATQRAAGEIHAAQVAKDSAAAAAKATHDAAKVTGIENIEAALREAASEDRYATRVLNRAELGTLLEGDLGKNITLTNKQITDAIHDIKTAITEDSTGLKSLVALHKTLLAHGEGADKAAIAAAVKKNLAQRYINMVTAKGATALRHEDVAMHIAEIGHIEQELGALGVKGSEVQETVGKLAETHLENTVKTAVTERFKSIKGLDALYESAKDIVAPHGMGKLEYMDFHTNGGLTAMDSLEAEIIRLKSVLAVTGKNKLGKPERDTVQKIVDAIEVLRSDIKKENAAIAGISSIITDQTKAAGIVAKAFEEVANTENVFSHAQLAEKLATFKTGLTIASNTLSEEQKALETIKARIAAEPGVGTAKAKALIAQVTHKDFDLAKLSEIDASDNVRTLLESVHNRSKDIHTIEEALKTIGEDGKTLGVQSADVAKEVSEELNAARTSRAGALAEHLEKDADILKFAQAAKKIDNEIASVPALRSLLSAQQRLHSVQTQLDKAIADLPKEGKTVALQSALKAGTDTPEKVEAVLQTAGDVKFADGGKRAAVKSLVNALERRQIILSEATLASAEINHLVGEGVLKQTHVDTVLEQAKRLSAHDVDQIEGLHQHISGATTADEMINSTGTKLQELEDAAKKAAETARNTGKDKTSGSRGSAGRVVREAVETAKDTAKSGGKGGAMKWIIGGAVAAAGVFGLGAVLNDRPRAGYAERIRQQMDEQIARGGGF